MIHSLSISGLVICLVLWKGSIGSYAVFWTYARSYSDVQKAVTVSNRDSHCSWRWFHRLLFLTALCLSLCSMIKLISMSSNGWYVEQWRSHQPRKKMSTQKQSPPETAEEACTWDIKNDWLDVSCHLPLKLPEYLSCCCRHLGSPLCLPDVAAAFYIFSYGDYVLIHHIKQILPLSISYCTASVNRQISESLSWP